MTDDRIQEVLYSVDDHRGDPNSAIGVTRKESSLLRKLK